MPNRNNAPLLGYVLDRLATNTTYPDVELLVVDDGSTDDSRMILKRWRDSGRFPEFRLLEREQRGAVETLNAGLAAATGELVVQLDADASIETPGWLERMASFFCSDSRIGVVTAKVVFDSGDIHACGVEVIGPEGFHDRGTRIAEPIGRRTYHQRVARFRDGECSACEELAEVDGGMGCCMMYRRKEALELGGYDPGFAPVWFDDLDLTLRLRRGGLKVFFMPEVHVIHHVNRRLAGQRGAQQVARTLRKGVGASLPRNVRRRLSRTLNLDRPPREQWQRLVHHYSYWRQKWGFDMLNPDMDAVRKRWGPTELCWKLNEEMRQAGQQMIAAFEASSASGRCDRISP